MKKTVSIILFSLLFTLAKSQPCGLTLIQLYSYTSGCGSCNDTLVVAGTGGNGALTYLWNNGMTDDTASGLCPGVYTCTVTDTANCTSTGTFVLTSVSPPIANPYYTNASCETCCDGIAVANVSGGNGPYTYSWSDGETTDTATGLCPGKYIVCVTDVNGCTSCDTIQMDITGISFSQENNFISIYPNPANDKIYFPLSENVEVINLSGEIILERKNCSGVNVAELANGIYFLNLISGDGNVLHGKFIKN
jgi:hypothetical protein